MFNAVQQIYSKIAQSLVTAVISLFGIAQFGFCLCYFELQNTLFSVLKLKTLRSRQKLKEVDKSRQ